MTHLTDDKTCQTGGSLTMISTKKNFKPALLPDHVISDTNNEDTISIETTLIELNKEGDILKNIRWKDGLPQVNFIVQNFRIESIFKKNYYFRLSPVALPT